MSKRVQYALSVPNLPAAPATETDRVLIYARGGGFYYRRPDGVEVGPLAGAGAAPSNMVTTDTWQEITAAKRFAHGPQTAAVSFSPNAWPTVDNTSVNSPALSFAPVSLFNNSETSHNILLYGRVNGDGTRARLYVTAQVEADQVWEGANRVYSPNNKVPASGLSATGTRDATTFLRGDDTWAVPTAAAPSNMVTTDTTQTISGGKDFTGALTKSGTAVVLTDDARLSDARTPAAHSHAIGDLPVAASGTSSTTALVRADDTRLANARTPTTHASTHATGGTDPLTPGAIGAAPSSHSHAIGDLPVATSGTSSTTQLVRADDSRLADARTPTAHTHGVADLTATGTRDATTFLRGDNTWATPAGGGGGTSGAEFDLTTDNVNTQPATPATGITLFARHRARRTLSYVGPQGQDTSLQPALFSNRIAMWNAVNGNATPQTYGLLVTPVGSATLINPVSTSFFTGMVRMRYASTATAGNAAGIRAATTQWFLSSTANLGGFFFVARWGMNQTTATNRIFVGMHTATASTTAAASTAIAGATNPSALLNMIGFGCDASQTTLRFMHNDATGTATMVDLGANFPATTAATYFYETRLFAPSGGGQNVHWSITRLNDGVVSQGVATTDLPALGTMLAAHVHHSNGTTAAAVHMDIQSMYIESDN